MSAREKNEEPAVVAREEHGGKFSLLVWRGFNRTKEFLKRLGFKKLPGSERIYIFLKRNLKPSVTVLLESHGNRMYADAKDEGVLPLLQKGGIYEEYETGLFKELLSPGDVVVDIGANIGHYTLIAARIVGDTGKVFAFEPDPHNYSFLVKNIEMNGFSNVTAVNKAVSKEQGTITLYLDKYNLGGHSFSRDNVHISAGEVTVETVSLDDFLAASGAAGRVDVIKMDTQGAEGFIIEGARRVLEENEPTMLMELWPFGLRNAGYDPATLIVNLEKLGYSFKVIDKDSEASVRGDMPDELRGVSRYRQSGEARESDAGGVIEMCASMKSEDEHVDLFLQI